jgi:hypothetical protein
LTEEEEEEQEEEEEERGLSMWEALSAILSTKRKR